MVGTVTNFGRNGLYDWLAQRVSAVILVAYVAFLLIASMSSGSGFESWTEIFKPTWVKLFSLLALLSLVAHAWVGMWTIITDYIKPVGLRLVITLAVILANIAYLVWGVMIVWSV